MRILWGVFAAAYFGPDGSNFSADVIADVVADVIADTCANDVSYEGTDDTCANGSLRLCPCGSNVSVSLRLGHEQYQMQGILCGRRRHVGCWPRRLLKRCR